MKKNFDTEIKKVDCAVGQMIKQSRLLLGMSRQEVAHDIGITQQQLSKYEKGTNKVSIGRLMLIGHKLQRAITHFLPQSTICNKVTIIHRNKIKPNSKLLNTEIS